MFLLVLKREREREREREKHWSPQPGIEPATFWRTRWHANQPSHPARAPALIFKLKYSAPLISDGRNMEPIRPPLCYSWPMPAVLLTDKIALITCSDEGRPVLLFNWTPQSEPKVKLHNTLLQAWIMCSNCSKISNLWEPHILQCAVWAQIFFNRTGNIHIAWTKKLLSIMWLDICSQNNLLYFCRKVSGLFSVQYTTDCDPGLFRTLDFRAGHTHS